ncbi:MAG: universal stress protein [Planctomycetaceae bacterium]|nr:universal stress protein [Planctomycetaceae bacterium]
MKNVMAAVDFSPVTDAVIETAAELAAALGGSMVILHVAADERDLVTHQIGPPSQRQWSGRDLERLRQRLEQIENTLKARGLPATALLVQGQVYDTIIDEAIRQNIDLLVMGTRGHGPLHHLLLGCVSQAVIESHCCRVLLVPKPAEK